LSDSYLRYSAFKRCDVLDRSLVELWSKSGLRYSAIGFAQRIGSAKVKKWNHRLWLVVRWKPNCRDVSRRGGIIL